MVNAIILVIIVVALILGARSYAGKVAHGCCGGESGETRKHVRVKDKNPAHYPNAVQMHVSGMTCANCAKRVEDALNGIGGVWAKVDWGKGNAIVRMKTKVTEEELRCAVAQAGYVVTMVESIAA